MDIKLYEYGSSRSLRCQWLLKELNLPYESVEDRSLFRSDELKKIHPLGKMPAAVIDGKPLFESSAICTFIAEQTKHIDLIAKQGTWSRAQHDQWVCFNLSELEAWLWGSTVNTFILPESERPAECIPQNEKMFKKEKLVILAFRLDKSWSRSNSE